MKEYIVLGLVQTGTVYLVYTPYVFLWIGLSLDQYFKWLIGGLPMSLVFSGFFARVTVWAKKRWFP